MKITDQELIKFAEEFRDGLIGKRNSSRSMCFMLSSPLGALLKQIGVETRLVEFELHNENEIFGHFCLELADKRILDVTADQFNDLIPGCNFPKVYLGEKPAIYKPFNENLMRAFMSYKFRVL
jgi:hypothetical protein